MIRVFEFSRESGYLLNVEDIEEKPTTGNHFVRDAAERFIKDHSDQEIKTERIV